MRLRTLLVSLVAVATAACGGHQELVQSLEPEPREETRVLPQVKPAVPALRVELDEPVDSELARDLERMEGISVAAPATVRRTTVRHEGKSYRLRVVAIDPQSYRSVSPTSTRDADFVWSALLAGDAVVTPDAARKLKFDGPEQLDIGASTFDVSAFASNGIPDLGDVLVDERALFSLGGDASHRLVVGLRPGADPEAAQRALAERLQGRIIGSRRLTQAPAQPDVPIPMGFASGDLVGTMHFRILKNGFIEPDPAWVTASIVNVSVPILGNVQCHRAVIPQLAEALAEIEEQGLAKKIDRRDYGGCFVPRFIDRDPRRGLSMHAFGLALDLNVSENYLGTVGAMDERIVAIFEKWGFEWGGRWARPDPMHFELDRLVGG